jgi:hypothetical protein
LASLLIAPAFLPLFEQNRQKAHLGWLSKAETAGENQNVPQKISLQPPLGRLCAGCRALKHFIHNHSLAGTGQVCHTKDRSIRTDAGDRDVDQV